MKKILALTALATVACSRQPTASSGAAAIAPVGGNGVAVVATGWDPYMVQRRAMTIRPGTPLFFESCPDLAGGKCHPALGPGAGFYSLAHDEPTEPQEMEKDPTKTAVGKTVYVAPENCRINSNDLMSYGTNQNVPCPYKFFWGNNFARLVNSTIGFQNGTTRNMYLGLQENVSAGILGGISFENLKHAPYMKDVVSIRMNVRAVRCRGNTVADTHSYGRLAMDFSGMNPMNREQGFSVTIDLDGFIDVPASDRGNVPVLSETEDHIDPAVQRPALHVPGPQWGIRVENGPIIHPDVSADCSAQLDGLPWATVEIPVREILKRLVQQGKLAQHLVDSSRYVHGTIAGLEQWGRSHFAADVAARVILVEAGSASAQAAQGANPIVPGGGAPAPVVGGPSASAGPTLTEGYYQAPSHGKFYFNGLAQKAFCWFSGNPPDGAIVKPTTVEPAAGGFRNDGRCSWDTDPVPPQTQPASPMPEGYYQGPAGKYYFNGVSAFCWFNGAPPGGAILQPTATEPSGAGFRNDGRCNWDQ